MSNSSGGRRPTPNPDPGISVKDGVSSPDKDEFEDAAKFLNRSGVSGDTRTGASGDCDDNDTAGDTRERFPARPNGRFCRMAIGEIGDPEA